MMSGIQTLATLVLGGAFDATELGENDIQPDAKLIEELQQRLVTGTDDVYVELIDRAELDRVTAENAALQQRLNAADQRIDEQRVALMRIRDRADAFAEDERGMQVASVEVIRDIAARALGEVDSPDQFRDVVKMIAERTPNPDFSLIGIVHTPPIEYDEP